MITYNDYLESIGVINEENFNNIIKSLPNIDNIDFDEDNKDEEDIAKCIIDKILYKFDYVYSDDIDLENKSFCLYDVDSLKDLEEIRKIFNPYGWKIVNGNIVPLP